MRTEYIADVDARDGAVLRDANSDGVWGEACSAMRPNGERYYYLREVGTSGDAFGANRVFIRLDSEMPAHEQLGPLPPDVQAALTKSPAADPEARTALSVTELTRLYGRMIDARMAHEADPDDPLAEYRWNRSRKEWNDACRASRSAGHIAPNTAAP